MLRKTLIVFYFIFLAGLGILIGCFIHGQRVNQTTVMSGVAFVRELPYGERAVGWIETTVFSYQERKNLEQYKQKHKGNIHIDPEVIKKHKELYPDTSRNNYIPSYYNDNDKMK
jgi:hypothetical protein